MNAVSVSRQNLDTVRAAIEHIGQGMTVFDADLRLVACNRRFLDLLDFPYELNQPGTDFSAFMRHNAERGEYGEGDVDELVRTRVEIARRFEPHSFDRHRPDGTILNVTGSPLPEGGFVTVYSDVTAERRREAELEHRVAERNLALRENEARLRVIANEVKAGIALLDVDLTIRYANLRFARAYGLLPDAIQGLASDRVLARATIAACRPRFAQALKGDAVDFDLEIDLPDGRRKDVRTFLRPELGADGQVTGFYVLSIDMTRQKAADRALAQAQKMEALGRLSAGIAHDFNNLLTIILGNLAPLREALPDGELVTDYLDPSLAAARRGGDLTGRLLTLARRHRSHPTPVNAAGVIQDVVGILRSSLPDEIELRAPPARSDVWLLADRGQLEMSLINLAVNAQHAVGAAGRITFFCDTVRLGSEQARGLKLMAGSYCRLRVEDTGKGMSSEEQRFIFDPFYSTKPDGGSGLGLAMVYSFIEQSNGAITVDSRPGEGATFTLYLPQTEPPGPQPAASDRGAAGDPASATLALLVEDNEAVRIVLRRQLVALGHPVVEAGSAEEAEALIENLPDLGLIITDVALPGEKSGSDLARTVAATWPEIATVLMTGHGTKSVAKASPAEAPVLQKPFEQAELAVAIRQAMRAVAPDRRGL